MDQKPRQQTPPESKPAIVQWDVYVAAAKARWLGSVDAEDEASAITEGAKVFHQAAGKLIAIRRG